jgi:hypothetical protein
MEDVHCTIICCSNLKRGKRFNQDVLDGGDLDQTNSDHTLENEHNTSTIIIDNNATDEIEHNIKQCDRVRGTSL